jgi:hypothetical protein
MRAGHGVEAQRFRAADRVLGAEHAGLQAPQAQPGVTGTRPDVLIFQGIEVGSIDPAASTAAGVVKIMAWLRTESRSSTVAGPGDGRDLAVADGQRGHRAGAHTGQFACRHEGGQRRADHLGGRSG